MTLIFTTISSKAVTMVGDRRLTIIGGRVHTEDAVKQGWLLTPDASVLFGYTGVAEVGNFRLQRWIGETLLNITEKQCLPFDELMYRLAEEATTTFRSHRTLSRVPATQKHTTIIFAGFLAGGDPVAAIVSNFERGNEEVSSTAWSDFEATVWRSSKLESTASAVFLSGNTRGLQFPQWSVLNDLLVQGKPVKALVGKSMQLLTEASKSHKSGNTIGQSKMVASLTFEAKNVVPQPNSMFVSEANRATVYVPDQVNLCPDERTFISDIQITSNDNQPLVYGVVSRNSLCSCGSKIKYKHCHGY